MRKSNFLNNIGLIINDQTNIINESSDDFQKLYFKNSTELHQNDNIVKEGLLKKVANAFKFGKNYAQIVKKTILDFNAKYKFAPVKKDGSKVENTYAKFQGEYLVMYQGDWSLLQKDKKQLTKQEDKELKEKGITFKLQVRQGDDTDKVVDGMGDLSFYVRGDSTVDQIAKVITQKINKLGIKLTTTENPGPSKSKENKNEEQTKKQKHQQQKSSDKNNRQQGMKAYNEGQGGSNVYYPNGQGLYQNFGGIPMVYLTNPGQFYQQVVKNLKNNEDLSKDQKQQTEKMAEKISKKFVQILKKLQQDQEAGKQWTKIKENLTEIPTLEVKD